MVVVEGQSKKSSRIHAIRDSNVVRHNAPVRAHTHRHTHITHITLPHIFHCIALILHIFICLFFVFVFGSFPLVCLDGEDAINKRRGGCRIVSEIGH